MVNFSINSTSSPYSQCNSSDIVYNEQKRACVEISSFITFQSSTVIQMCSFSTWEVSAGFSCGQSKRQAEAQIHVITLSSSPPEQFNEWWQS